MSLYDFRKAQVAASLSNYSYTMPNKSPEGYKIVAQQKNSQTGYIGIAYYNQLNGEVYIICAASKKLKNRHSPLLNLNYLPIQLEDAQNFYQLALLQTRHLTVSEYILGGHALQGGIQQLIGAKYLVVTYTFQAPGMGLIAPQFNVDPSKNYEHIHNVRSLSDVVTLSGNQMGNVILTDIPTGHGLKHFNDYISQHTYTVCAINSRVWNTGKNLLLEAIPIHKESHTDLMFENAGMMMSYAWAEVMHQLDPLFMPKGVSLQAAFKSYTGNLEYLTKRLNHLVEQTPLLFDDLFTQVIAKLLLENTLLTGTLTGDANEQLLKNFIQFFDHLSYYPLISDLVAENTNLIALDNSSQFNGKSSDRPALYTNESQLNYHRHTHTTSSSLEQGASYLFLNNQAEQNNINTAYPISGPPAYMNNPILNINMRKNYYQNDTSHIEFNPNLLALNLKGSGWVSNLATAAAFCPHLAQLAQDLMVLNELNEIKLKVSDFLQVWANTAMPVNINNAINIKTTPVIFYASNLDFNVRPYLAIAAADDLKRLELCAALNKRETHRAVNVYQFHDEFLKKVIIIEAFSGTPLLRMKKQGLTIGHYGRQASSYVATDGKLYHYFSITSFVLANLEFAYNSLIDAVTNQILHTNLIRPYVQSIGLKINEHTGNYQIDLRLFKHLLAEQSLETFLYITALLTKYAGTALIAAGWNGWEILTDHETKINRNKKLLFKLKELNFIF